jgi:hypothetical protein
LRRIYKFWRTNRETPRVDLSALYVNSSVGSNSVNRKSSPKGTLFVTILGPPAL